MSYTNTFGGSTAAAAAPSFTALTLSANTALVWPLESTGGVPFVASWMNVTATAGGLQLQMPPANTGSTGVAAIVANVGTNSFTVTDTAGNAITPVAAGQVWVIVLTTNATTNGLWTSAQLASTTSVATAAALAGLGLQANGAQLQVNWPSVQSTTAYTITAANRGNVVIYNGTAPGGTTFSINGSATLGAGFVCAISNESTSNSNLTLTSGAGELFNNQQSLVLTPGLSAILICYIAGGAGAFVVVGSVDLFPSLSVANGLFTVDVYGNAIAPTMQISGTLSAESSAFTVGVANGITGAVQAGSLTIPWSGLTHPATQLSVGTQSTPFYVSNGGAVYGPDFISNKNIYALTSVNSATFFVAGVSLNLTYTGTSAPGYYQMGSNQYNVFSSGAAGGGALLCANPVLGQRQTVINNTANVMVVSYPQGANAGLLSWNINSGNGVGTFVCVSLNSLFGYPLWTRVVTI